jgi:hypothetical protein
VGAVDVCDDAEAAGADELLPAALQLADPAATVPPPSNTEVEAGIPAIPVVVEAPMPAPLVDAPVMALPIPDAVPAPKDTSGTKLVMTPHWVAPAPDRPSGSRAGGAGVPGPIPSGDVAASGVVPGNVLVAPTWAKAELQPKRSTSVAAVTERVMYSPPRRAIERSDLANASAIGGRC